MSAVTPSRIPLTRSLASPEEFPIPLKTPASPEKTPEQPKIEKSKSSQNIRPIVIPRSSSSSSISSGRLKFSASARNSLRPPPEEKKITRENEKKAKILKTSENSVKHIPVPSAPGLSHLSADQLRRLDERKEERRVKLTKYKAATLKSLSNEIPQSIAANGALISPVLGGLDAEFLPLLSSDLVFSAVGNSAIDGVREALKRRGWVENPYEESPYFHFQWSVLSRLIDYSSVSPYQFLNHHPNEHFLTSKTGLTNSLRNFSHWNQRQVDEFFPYSYNIQKYEQSVKELFEQTFLFYCALGILQEYEELSSPPPPSSIDESSPSMASSSSSSSPSSSSSSSSKRSRGPMKQLEFQLKQWLLDYREKENPSEEEKKKEGKENEEKEPRPRFSFPYPKTRPYFLPPDFPSGIPSFLTPAILALAFSFAQAFLQEKDSLEEENEGKGKSKAFSLTVEERNILLKTSAALKSRRQQWENIHHLEDFQEITGNSSSYMEISPILSLLDDYYQETPQYYLNGINNLWIIKPGGLSRGRGIEIHSSIEDIYSTMRKGGKYLIQKYIEYPLLVYEKKFDLRQWIIVLSMNSYRFIYFYSLGCYFRFSTQSFTRFSQENSIHLTNHSIQSKEKDFDSLAFCKGNQWESREFYEFLEKSMNFSPGDGKILWEKFFQPQMEEIAMAAVESAEESIDYRPFGFSLYGLDYMIDDSGHVWLLEINSSPTLQGISAPGLVQGMIEHLMELLIDHPISPFYWIQQEREKKKREEEEKKNSPEKEMKDFTGEEAAGAGKKEKPTAQNKPDGEKKTAGSSSSAAPSASPFASTYSCVPPLSEDSIPKQVGGWKLLSATKIGSPAEWQRASADPSLTVVGMNAETIEKNREKEILRLKKSSNAPTAKKN